MSFGAKMKRPQVQGWCPGALRPMPSGDGLVMRIRPRLGRLSRLQLQALAGAAVQYGAGVLDFTSRANVQLRALGEEGWARLCDHLGEFELLDADVERERRRNIILNPDWQSGDESMCIAAELSARLAELPTLPAKFGFAIDAGAAPCLQQVSADLRIERSRAGGLIARLDGREHGFAVSTDSAVDALVALAHWFADSGGAESGRVARHAATLPRWAQGKVLPAAAAVPLANGAHALGWVSTLAFGQLAADRLLAVLEDEAISGVRLTPWRQLIFEGLHAAPVLGEDAALAQAAAAQGWRIEACAGAPQCVQATVATRTLAGQLLQAAAAGTLVWPETAAPPLRLAGLRVAHVSGCAKGCANPGAAAVCLVGEAAEGANGVDRFTLALNARAGAVAAEGGESVFARGLDGAGVCVRLGVS